MFAARALYREEVRLQGVKVGWRMRTISLDLCLSGCKGRGVQGLAQVGRGLGAARPVFQVRSLSLRTHSQGDLGHSGKAPSLGLALVDS